MEKERDKPMSDDQNQPPQGHGVTTLDGERELMTGLLSGEASFRLIVTGKGWREGTRPTDPQVAVG
jgi:hypothetical protein